MEIVNKSDLICPICNKLLSEPIQLPCFCTICHAHLTDKYVKDGVITCVTCSEEFLVDRVRYKVNKLAKILLESDEDVAEKTK